MPWLYPIIDAHVHLWPASEASTIRWFSSATPLPQQQSVDEYKFSTKGAARGLVIVEVDRKSDLREDSEDGWKHALMEAAFMSRVSQGMPRHGEGHDSRDSQISVGYIPWAPIPGGPAVLERYLDAVHNAVGSGGVKIKGYRYLIQDKPRGISLHGNFIESLKLLGRKGLTFDVCVDFSRQGKVQLGDIIEMVHLAHQNVAEEERVVFIIDHMCKPNFHFSHTANEPTFLSWRAAIGELSKSSNTYMKLSGVFPGLPQSVRERSAQKIFKHISDWLFVVGATFGPRRMMFASDWPVCDIGVGADVAWTKWKDVVEIFCDEAMYGDAERRAVFGETAMFAYGLGQ